MKNRNIIIAIDGHSSCGKSTLAKDIASKLNYIYVDSGAMYRCVTLFVMTNYPMLLGSNIQDEILWEETMKQIHISFTPASENGSRQTILNGVNVENEIRSLKISQNVSLVSSVKIVRTYLVKAQQSMGKEKGIVMDGRDIGTVVFPEAELKIFMTARPEIRAQRRFAEMEAKGEKVSFEEILANIELRDQLDSTRQESPLKKAAGACILDNSEMDRQQQLDWTYEKYLELISQ